MSVDVERLSQLNPFGDVSRVDASREAVTEAARRWRDTGFAVGIVDGAQMRTLDAMFAEFARSLQFPAFFAHEWKAFGECLADLDWLSLDLGVVVVVLDAHQVLQRVRARRRDGARAQLMRTLHDAANTFATPVTLGEWWDRPAIPFHVVLQARGRQVAHAEGRWGAAGAMLRPLALSPLDP